MVDILLQIGIVAILGYILVDWYFGYLRSEKLKEVSKEYNSNIKKIEDREKHLQYMLKNNELYSKLNIYTGELYEKYLEASTVAEGEYYISQLIERLKIYYRLTGRKILNNSLFADLIDRRNSMLEYLKSMK